MGPGTALQDIGKMSIKVNLYSSLQKYTGNQPVVEVEGSTVGECLDHLLKKYPLLKPELTNQSGGFLPHVYISTDLNRSKPVELTSPVKEGDELNIILIIAGG
jgi:molybdopterin converting factor small subunit